MERFTKHLWGLLRTENLSSVVKQRAAGDGGNVFREKCRDARQKSVQELFRMLFPLSNMNADLESLSLSE